MSWATQHGKYVSLFEPDLPWHTIKMKECSPEDILVQEQILEQKPDQIPEQKKEDFTEKKSNIIDFNTIACLLLLLIIILVAIRYYYFPKK
jgi:hypothetical protein